jgi:hypothetical protein
LTVTDPPPTGATPPTPLSMTAEVAFELVHLKVADPPCEMEPGLAVKVLVGLGWTVTVD